MLNKANTEISVRRGCQNALWIGLLWLLGFQSAFGQQVPEVRKVHIDLNSAPTMPHQSDTVGAQSLAAASESDELSRLKAENAKLKAQLEPRAARKALATAIAIVTLEYGGKGTLTLAQGDFFELENVKFMKAKRDGFLRWDEIKQAAKSQENANAISQGVGGQAVADALLSQRPAPSIGDAGKSAAAEPVVPEPASHATDTQKPDQHKREERKQSRVSLLSEEGSPKAVIQVKDGNLAIEMKMADVALVQETVPGDQDAGFEGNGLVTYQQPMRPWKIIYLQEGAKLQQWVHFANFTAYEWKATMPITISDRNSLGFEPRLTFRLGKSLAQGKSAIQFARAFDITKNRYVANLVEGKAQALKIITLSDAKFLPSGEFRDEFQPHANRRQATLVDGELVLGPDPRAFIDSETWEEKIAYEPLELNAGVFLIRTTRKSEFNLKNIGDSGSVLLNKAAGGWKLSTPGWATNDDDVHQLTVSDFSDSTVELFEYLETALDINDPENFESFKMVANSIRGRTPQTQMEQKLVSLVDKKLSIENNDKELAKAEAEYKKLKTIYDRTQLGEDVINDNSRRITLRSLWERMNALGAKIENLTQSTKALHLQIDLDSYSKGSAPL